MQKRCPKCGELRSTSEFFADAGSRDGLGSNCKPCRMESQRRYRAANKAKHGKPAESTEQPAQPKRDEHAERQRRIESDYAPLRPSDFDVGALNDGKIDPQADRDKKQEYSRQMGEYMDSLRGVARGDDMDERHGAFIANVAEGERRFQNRRNARTLNLAAANEALMLRAWTHAARTHLSGRVEPTGYALRPSREKVKRKAVLFLSDLHIGAQLDNATNPQAFGAVEEARRLEWVGRQWFDFKPEHRANTEGVLLLGGDVIEGLLMHDIRDGAPLVEQQVAFLRYFEALIGTAAQVFPRVHVECQPGNHGRNIARHPGRATSSKWDGIEWFLYYALAQSCARLPNVTFSHPRRAVSVLDFFGSKVLFTHGDTEIKLGDPDTKQTQNAAILNTINTRRTYGHEFAALLFGHFHKPRYQAGSAALLCNGALVPPNGHARSSGYIADDCGQWLFEAVEGFPIGDVRLIRVGPQQDRDERLGTIIKPFRFEDTP